MNRTHLVSTLAAVLAAPALMAASPSPNGSLLPTGTFALATVARIVPAPNPNAPGYTAAPTPNSSVSEPLSRDSDAPGLSPGLFRPKRTYNGEGFLQGSTVQGQQERKAAPPVGVNLSVPLN